VNRGGSSPSVRFRIQCDNALSCLIRNGTNGFIIDGANNVDVVGFDIGNAPNAAWAIGVIYEGSSVQSTSGNSVHMLNNYGHDIAQTFNGPFGPGCPDVGMFQANNQHGHYVTDAQIIGNRINNYAGTGLCSDGHRHGAGIYATTIGAVIQNNIVSNTNNMAIQVSDNGCQAVIVNNTIFNARSSGIVLNGTGICSNPGNNTVSNNIVVNVAGTGLFAGGGSCTSSHPTLWSNNDVFGSGVADYNGQTSCDVVQNKRSESPTTTFINYRADGLGDYHLKDSSLAIGAGTTTCVSGGISPCAPNFDMAGLQRPSPPSIGVYESGSQSATAPAAPTALVATVQ